VFTVSLSRLAGSDESTSDPSLLLGKDDLDDLLHNWPVNGNAVRRQVTVDAGDEVNT
jgi:hypothetical protein